MKIKLVLVVLALACIGLGIALWTTRHQAQDQHANDVASVAELSKQVAEAHVQVKEVGQVNVTLSNDVASSQQQLAQSAEQIAQLSNSLVAANAAQAQTSNSLANAQELVTNLNTRLADLEAQNQLLDQQAQTLRANLAQLTAQIEETRRQLAVSKTNAVFLRGELQKQLAQKAELEHKFNDLEELRGQLKKLKDERFMARRREWMANDNSNKKGATLLMMHQLPSSTPASHQPPPSAYDLNVEIGSDGSYKVLPAPGRTNTPAH